MVVPTVIANYRDLYHEFSSFAFKGTASERLSASLGSAF
jgi:hypothetical protein